MISGYKHIRLVTSEYGKADGSARIVDQIELHVCDMKFFKDITGERDEALARRLAGEMGLEVEDFRKATHQQEREG